MTAQMTAKQRLPVLLKLVGSRNVGKSNCLRVNLQGYTKSDFQVKKSEAPQQSNLVSCYILVVLYLILSVSLVFNSFMLQHKRMKILNRLVCLEE